MPSFNNYTFSDVTYTIAEGDLITTGTGGVAVITISPISGYTLDVADFSLAPGFSNSYVNSVVFSQDGSNVRVTVNLTAGTVMPSSNLSIPLCILGSGEVDLVTIAGKYSSVVGSNVTPTSETNIVYSNSGSVGESELLFSKTYTADSGYYFDIIPTAQILAGNQSNYNIVQTPTYDIGGQLTALQFDVNYIYPNNDTSGNEIKFTAQAKQIYVPVQEITRWNILNSVIPVLGENRTLYVWGEAGATYSITLSDGTTVQNIATNITIGSNGLDQYLVTFGPNALNNNVTWTFTISGDISGTLPTTITLTQAQQIEGTFLPKASSVFSGGFSVVNNGDYLAIPTEDTSEAIVSIEWLITSTDGNVITISEPPVSQIAWDNQDSITQQVISAAAGTATLTSTTGLVAGMRFNADGSVGAPLDYEIVSVDSPTQITYTPTDLVIVEIPGETIGIGFTDANGFLFDTSNLVTAFANDERTAVTISGDINVEIFGDEDTSFYLDLEQVLDVLPIVECGSLQVAGGQGITEYSIPLSPSGGLLTFLTFADGVVDKFEIIHGDQSGVKVATSSMIASNNAGPFDNTFSTPPTNIMPTTAEAQATDQFIGTDVGTPPTRQTEFNVDTGYEITSMNPGGIGTTTYQQVLWWKYSAADYDANSMAILRITGSGIGTAWTVLRECCPSGNCTLTTFVPSAFDMTASNTSPTNACADATYTNIVYTSNDNFTFGGIVYTDVALTTPFVGDSGHYRIDRGSSTIAAQINSNGEIIQPITLCS